MNQTARTITQQGILHFASDDLSPMEIARRIETVGICVTKINVVAPLRPGEDKEVEF